MNRLEIQAVYKHLEQQCKGKGLRSAFLIVDNQELSIKIWKQNKNQCKTVMDASCSIHSDESLRKMLLDINEALHETTLENIFS